MTNLPQQNDNGAAAIDPWADAPEPKSAPAVNASAQATNTAEVDSIEAADFDPAMGVTEDAELLIDPIAQPTSDPIAQPIAQPATPAEPVSMPQSDSVDPSPQGDHSPALQTDAPEPDPVAAARMEFDDDRSSRRRPEQKADPNVDSNVDSNQRQSAENASGDKPADDRPAAPDRPTPQRTVAPPTSQTRAPETRAPETRASEPRAPERPPTQTPPAETSPAEVIEYAPGEVPFAELPLADEVRRAVELAGYRTATAIQSAIIPPMVERRDVLAQSQTGSGKTAAFALPVLTNIDTRDRSIQCLVLTPTRELAVQVSRSFTGYGEEVRGLNVTAIYGGQDYQPQLRALKRGSQVVVGTPGRVIDHIKRGSLDLSNLQTLVLDEADEMLNMGFLEDVEFVLQQTPPTRQIALFSATMPGPIAQLSKRYLNDPARVSIGTQKLTADSIRQRAVFVAPRDKLRLLKRFLETESTEGVIVFVKTREATVTLAESLVRDGLNAAAINGDMPQNVRERTIAHLKSGRLDVLVATDVAARGLDVQRISHVFNFDLPHDSESYVHRIGRTGRAGRSGEAIIFLSNSQRHRLRTISRVTGQDIEVIQPPAVEDVNSRRAQAFAEKIDETVKTEDLTLLKELVDQHVVASGQSIQDVAAALAHMNQRGRPFFLNEDPIGPPRGRRDENRDSSDDGGENQRRGKRNGPPGQGMVRYRLAVGHRDNIHVGNIVGAVANEAGLTNAEIGPIKIHESFSTIDLPEGMPGEVFQTLQRTRVGGRPLSIREWSDAPPRGRTGAPPRARSGGPPNAKSGGGGGRPGGFGGKPKTFKKKFNGPPPSGKRKKK